MATIPLSNFTANGLLADPAGTASGATNTVSAAVCPVEEIVLRAVVATATTNVTVKAGDSPPALAAGQGDHVEACPVGTSWLGPFTSSRFVQSDGTLTVDVATPANVTLAAFRVPRAV